MRATSATGNGVLVQIGPELSCLGGECGRRASGDQPGGGDVVLVVRGGVGVFGGWGLFEDEVSIGTTDPERRHPCPTRPTHLRPLPLLSQQPHPTTRPIHMRTRLLGIQRPGQHPMPQRQHHLQHPSHPRSRLRMTKIRLQRPQPQRPTNRPTPPIRRQQRLRLNRIPQPSPRPMPLHHINITHRQTSAIQRPTNHPLLRRPIRRGQAVARTVFVHGAAANYGPDLMPVTAGVGQSLQHQHPHPLRQPSPFRPHPEGPAPTIAR